jgi:uncharacterized membrane protein
MEGVARVRQLGDRQLHLAREDRRQDKTWDADITEQIPDDRIAWRARSGAANAGVVTFHRITDGRTRIMLQLEYEPEGIVEKAGDAVGIVSHRVEGDLLRFKEFIEQRGRETGACAARSRRSASRRERLGLPGSDAFRQGTDHLG